MRIRGSLEIIWFSRFEEYIVTKIVVIRQNGKVNDQETQNEVKAIFSGGSKRNKNRFATPYKITCDINETIKLLSDPENISKIADEIIALHSQITREQSVLHLLQDERAKIQTTLNNVMRAIEEGILTPTTKARMNELENSLADINIKISAEEAKLERTLKKSDVEGYIIDALNSNAKTLIEILVEKVTLYEDKIEISFRYSKNTNPDETLTEVHRDFLLYGTKMIITQRSFTAIFELIK